MTTIQTIMMKNLPASLREDIVDFIGCEWSKIASKFNIEATTIRARTAGYTPLDSARTLVEMLCDPNSNWKVSDLCKAFTDSELNRYAFKTEEMLMQAIQDGLLNPPGYFLLHEKDYQSVPLAPSAAPKSSQTANLELSALREELRSQSLLYQQAEQRAAEYQQEIARLRQELDEARRSRTTEPKQHQVVIPNITMSKLAPQQREMISQVIAPHFDEVAAALSDSRHDYASECRCYLPSGHKPIDLARQLVGTFYSMNFSFPEFIQKISEVDPKMTQKLLLMNAIQV